MAVDPLFLDTSVIVAASVAAHPSHQTARSFVTARAASQTPFCISPQICREFLAVLTRQPVSGVTFTVEAAVRALEEWRKGCTLLAETDATVASCVELVGRHQVRGKQVHDCNVVAVMLAHGVPQLATRNAADFTRFTEILVEAV